MRQQHNNIVRDIIDMMQRHEIDSPELLMDLVIYITVHDFNVAEAGRELERKLQIERETTHG